MKLLFVSRLSEPVREGYDRASAVNQEVYWLAREMQGRHKVSVVCREESELPAGCEKVAVKASKEAEGFKEYSGKLKGHEAIVDFSDEKWSTTLKEEKKLSVLYVCHPGQGYRKPPPLRHPCFVGVSEAHSVNLSGRLGVPVRTLPFGVPSPGKDGVEKKKNLLFFGRVVKERGCHEFVSLCVKRRIPGVVAGDDVHVDQPYVQTVLAKCDGKLLRYYGAVGEKVKATLLREARALVIPYLSDEDAYSLMTAKQALAVGTPVFTLEKGSVREVGGISAAKALEGIYSKPVQRRGRPGSDWPFWVRKTAERLEHLVSEALETPW